MPNVSAQYRETRELEDLPIEELDALHQRAIAHANIYYTCHDGSYEMAQEYGGLNAIREELERRNKQVLTNFSKSVKNQ